MKKSSPRAATTKVREIEPFDKRSVNLANFKRDLSAKDLENLLYTGGGVFRFPFTPIETLSATKTLGRGRTNLTIIMPTIVQIDTTVPYAGFNRETTPARNPGIQMHFEPIAYGIGSVATYVMEFSIQVSGSSTFNLTGGPVPVLNGGTKVLGGQTTVSLIFQNLSPSQQVYGYLEQTAGADWQWFSTQVHFPDLVLTM